MQNWERPIGLKPLTKSQRSNMFRLRVRAGKQPISSLRPGRRNRAKTRLSSDSRQGSPCCFTINLLELARSGWEVLHAFEDDLRQLQHLLGHCSVFRDVTSNAIAIGL